MYLEEKTIDLQLKNAELVQKSSNMEYFTN